MKSFLRAGKYGVMGVIAWCSYWGIYWSNVFGGEEIEEIATLREFLCKLPASSLIVKSTFTSLISFDFSYSLTIVFFRIPFNELLEELLLQSDSKEPLEDILHLIDYWSEISSNSLLIYILNITFRLPDLFVTSLTDRQFLRWSFMFFHEVLMGWPLILSATILLYSLECYLISWI